MNQILWTPAVKSVYLKLTQEYLESSWGIMKAHRGKRVTLRQEEDHSMIVKKFSGYLTALGIEHIKKV